MGGRDKAWLRWRGQPLLCHALARLQPQVDRMLVSANRHAWAYRRLGLQVLADASGWSHAGPLAGVATALRFIGRGRLAIVPVDAPRAPRSQVARLAQALDRGAPAAALVCAREGRRQPLFALLDAGLADRAAQALAGRERPSMQDWLDSVGVRWVTWPAEPSTFSNLNEPQDLRALDASLAR